ncbi:hypothetical protein BKH41_01730 [Helicobacter sp. 12S02232-10]|uniref:NAD(P)H-dependent oxidoreductase n=1 Tax=Helicobacter sp. 12S02232-10 TaxID=1476197 RepID=UPI000BA56CC4|nr:NAD(P)H-dependent oxidoreductase [Helicobacter sp. 12S02232-10]PAF49413.1 hypothetical protein BKH41_01730 [Helicobacter sp. 12S02232-10]
MQKEEVLKLLYRRYSCRKFDGYKKIPREDFELILEAGRLAPSSLGLETWKFIVIASESLKEQIATDSPSNQVQIQTCSHLLVVCHLSADVLRPDSNYLNTLYENVKSVPETYDKAKIRTALQSVCENRLKGDEKLINAYAREQCFIAIGQMAMSAAMLGIDSCIIGGFYAAGVKKLLNDFMNVDDLQPACLMTFGYGAENKNHLKRRKPYEDAVKWI